MYYTITRFSRMHTLWACWGGWGCFYTGVAAMLRIALTPAYNRESHPTGVISINLCSADCLCGHCAVSLHVISSNFQLHAVVGEVLTEG